MPAERAPADFDFAASGRRVIATEVRGLEAIASGFSLRYPRDEDSLAAQFEVYDALYAWCRLQAAQGG